MIKENIIKYRTSKNEKGRKAETQLDFSQCKKIGIIIHENFEDEERINFVIEELKDLGKKVSKIYFLKKPEGHQMSPWFKPSQINLLGQVKSPELDHFLKQRYDYLLCFDDTGNYIIDYVMSMVNSPSRIGLMKPERNHIFEMMVQVNGTGSGSSEILKYLKMIRSNGD